MNQNSLDGISLIKASAGTGKTYTLTACIHDLINKGVPPECLVATTFTNKAAAELQQRIRTKILQSDDTDTPETRQEKIKKAQGVLDGLIGTVNGICGQLLSEYAIDAGWNPHMNVLPAEDEEAIFKAAASNVFESADESIEAAAFRLGYTDRENNPFREGRDWQKEVRNVINAARSNCIEPEQLNASAKMSCETLKDIFGNTASFSLAHMVETLKALPELNATSAAAKERVQSLHCMIRTPTWPQAIKVSTLDFSKKEKECFCGALEGWTESILNSTELYADLCTLIRGIFACAAAAMTAYKNYKTQHGLMDFSDQETEILKMLQREDFRAVLKHRLSKVSGNQIMVDEFQDTSPIQFELFRQLNTLTGGSIWVGDIKQAIYGFRGTSPKLIQSVSEAIERANNGRDTTILNCSWRSKSLLIDLANTLFAQVFPEMNPADFTLDIPEARTAAAEGGSLETWCIPGGNEGTRIQQTAAGIADLIRRKKEENPCFRNSDIAVLFRSNSACGKLAEALNALNIAASSPSNTLLVDEPECQLVLAAYRYCVDPEDTAALPILMAFYAQEPQWFNTFVQARQNDPASVVPESLRQLHFLKNCTLKADETPLEILDRIILELKIDERLRSMRYSERKMANINALRKACNDYMNRTGDAENIPAPEGFFPYLKALERPSPESFGENTVNIMTYHASKGLEWPIVILGSLNAEEKGDVFGLHVVQDTDAFSIENPLAGRKIRYWPRPFGQKSVIEEIDVNAIALNREILRENVEESKRLFYVGLTRAKDTLVFLREKSTRKVENPWIERIFNASGNETKHGGLNFPDEPGEGNLFIGEKEFPVTTYVYEETAVPTAEAAPAVWVDTHIESNTVHLPARRAPNKLHDATARARLVSTFSGPKITIAFDPDEPEQPVRLGNAFHAYYRLCIRECPPEETAKRLLQQWKVAELLEPAAVVDSACTLHAWLHETYPKRRIRYEVPMSYRDPSGTLFQGQIDMLVETPEGFVIIDHKTVAENDLPALYAGNQSGQLHCYARAVEAATGKKVLAKCVHLPLLGLLYIVE